MIDEIFEMIMKEARSRPGPDLHVKAFDVLFELKDRVIKACNIELSSFLDNLPKVD